MEVIFKNFAALIDQLIELSLSKLKWREKRQNALLSKTKERQFTLLDLKKYLNDQREESVLDQDFCMANTLRESMIGNPFSLMMKSTSDSSMLKKLRPKTNVPTKREKNLSNEENKNNLFFKFNPTQSEKALKLQNFQQLARTGRKMTTNSPIRKIELLRQISTTKMHRSAYKESFDNNGRAPNIIKNQCENAFFMGSKFNYNSISPSKNFNIQKTFDYRGIDRSSSNDDLGIFSIKSQINNDEIGKEFQTPMKSKIIQYNSNKSNRSHTFSSQRFSSSSLTNI